ncbi:MAG: hypothetical protein ACM3SP_01415 [Chloroflexota bacterium]
MDEPNRLKIAVAPLRFRPDRGLLLLILLTIALPGCFSPESSAVPMPSVSAFRDLVQALAQSRGLPVAKEIRLNRKEINGAASLESAFSSPVPIPDLERAYKSVGLLANDAQLGKAWGEYRHILRLIDYNSATATLSLAPGAARLGAPLERANPRAARELPVALGIALALQEQQFNWRERIRSMASEDRRAAFYALTGGDAALAAISLVSSKTTSSAAILTASAQIAAEVDKLAAALPGYMRRQLTLPYRAGSQFIYWAYKARGWPGVNALYVNPPVSTAEILHPEKYFLQHAAPLRYFPAALLRRYKEIPNLEQSLGEDAVAASLASAHPEKSADATASGWRGDRLFAFRDGANLTTAWFSSWSTENQAREFLQAYRAVLEHRHAIRFNFSPAPKNAPWIASGGDQRGWLLQNRGTVVLLISAAPAGRLIDLANDAWLDLEIEKETMDLPFDLGKRSRQLSLVSR